MWVMLVLLIAAAVVLPNAVAILWFRSPAGRLARAGWICGWSGLAATGALVIAVLDLFSQIWVRRPGYEGEFVAWGLIAVGVATLGSSACLAAAAVRRLRARREAHAIS